MYLDIILFQTINNLAGKRLWLDRAAIFAAEYLGYCLLIFLVFLIGENYKKYWLPVGLSLVAALFSRLGIVELIRLFWERKRPFLYFNPESINLLIAKINEPSFPSGHTAFFFALATVIYLHHKKIGIVFLFLSLIIGISRIFVGVHWPTDILVGIIAGVFIGLTINLLKDKLKMIFSKSKVTDKLI